MSQENVEIARRAHGAFSSPDVNAFDLKLLYRYADPDMVVDWSRSHGLEAGIYRGESETRRFWQTFPDTFDRVVVDALEFIDHGDYVVVPHHLHASGVVG